MLQVTCRMLRAVEKSVPIRVRMPIGSVTSRHANAPLRTSTLEATFINNNCYATPSMSSLGGSSPMMRSSQATGAPASWPVSLDDSAFDMNDRYDKSATISAEDSAFR
jgi:hypothetical protein